EKKILNNKEILKTIKEKNSPDLFNIFLNEHKQLKQEYDEAFADYFLSYIQIPKYSFFNEPLISKYLPVSLTIEKINNEYDLILKDFNGNDVVVQY
uniref:hypothetical protein n=1 Tax=Salmonella enterica TaxID=28901 RepID=UPI0019606871